MGPAKTQIREGVVDRHAYSGLLSAVQHPERHAHIDAVWDNQEADTGGLTQLSPTRVFMRAVSKPASLFDACNLHPDLIF